MRKLLIAAALAVVSATPALADLMQSYGVAMAAEKFTAAPCAEGEQLRVNHAVVEGVLADIQIYLEELENNEREGISAWEAARMAHDLQQAKKDLTFWQHWCQIIR